MAKNKVSHFEIPTTDFKKAQSFYGKVFDWKFDSYDESEGEYLMTMTVDSDKDGMPAEKGGINGGFYKKGSKNDHPSVVVETDSIDATAKAIEAAGGKITEAKHPIGEWGFMADFTDPDGNELSLWEKAK
jgi:predicted enzyme related to lactoylglutathione lyase